MEVNLGKSVLLIGYNFSPELTGIGKYSGEMVQWLAKKGYACTVLTTYPYYPHWKVQHPYRKNRFWFKKEVISHPQQGKVTIYRCPIYVPALPSGKKRMLLDLSFFVSAMIPLLKLIWSKKFDSVITIAPSFQLGFLGLLYKTFRKANHIYHIQDLQIEVARDLGMIRSPRIIRILLRLEKFIMEHSEVVSSISEGMLSKIKKKTNTGVILFPNWVDTSFFFPITDQNTLKPRFGFASTDKIVLYSGAVG
ncbi:MAG: glycosyltransferase, partial [Bacteroidota bacterium]